MSDKGRAQHIYMLGIGGSGMSGIAEVLLAQGYIISGADLSDSDVVQRLISLGATICFEHSADNLSEVDIVVKSTAIQDDNPELIAGRIPDLNRPSSR